VSPFLFCSGERRMNKKSITLKAFAKINLGLDVIRRREDGYHEVCMVMQRLNLYDTITIKKIKKDAIIIKTNKSFLPVNESNIIYKAIALMQEEYKLAGGIFVELIKRIPVAAGMAGGSADAAATLWALNELFELNLSAEELMAQGLKLGADVPYCVMGGSALAEGIGEKLTPVKSLSGCYVLVVKPDISVSTKFVYQNLTLDENTIHPDIKGIVDGLENDDLNKVCNLFGNVLEDVTVKHYPIITEIKDFVKENGGMNALMSGSGPTVFGIFTDKSQAQNCYWAVKEKWPRFQVHITEAIDKIS